MACEQTCGSNAHREARARARRPPSAVWKVAALPLRASLVRRATAHTGTKAEGGEMSKGV